MNRILPLTIGQVMAASMVAQPVAPAPAVPAPNTHFGTKFKDPCRDFKNSQDPAVAAWTNVESEHAGPHEYPALAAALAKRHEFWKLLF